MSILNKFRSRSMGIMKDDEDSAGFIMVTLVSFMGIILILGAVVLMMSVQAQRISLKQNTVQQAQLASTAAMEVAKEEYELDIDYSGTAGEVVLSLDSLYRTTYEVESLGYTNAANTQQKIRGTGRVYSVKSGSLISKREIVGKLIRNAGSGRSERFIFVIDNSGSMSISEWNDSKGTVDIAINYILDNVPTAEIAIVQYGTNHYSHEHKYDVTIPFTKDRVTALTWARRYGNGTTAYWDRQDHMAASLARMRNENVYGAGGELDLSGATNIQYVVFTDAYGAYTGGCCTSLKKVGGESFDTTNGGSLTVEDEHGEFNSLKDGTVFAEHGFPGLESQFTILNINTSSSWQTVPTSAAIASPGGSWTGVIDSNPGDPEGEGILPRRFINTSLLITDPNDILDILDEIFEYDLNI